MVDHTWLLAILQNLTTKTPVDQNLEPENMSEGMIASYFSDSPPLVEFSAYNFVIFVKLCDFVMFRLSIVILGNILNLQILKNVWSKGEYLVLLMFDNNGRMFANITIDFTVISLIMHRTKP